MQYLEWNELIARYFFNPRSAGKPVYLAVSRRLIEQLGGDNADFRDFIWSLKSGPAWASGKYSICDKALKACRDWRERKLGFPPSIGYLSLFVLAVEEESPEHGPLAYYNLLRKLLSEPAQVNRPYPRFDKMIELWEDLEVWSRDDKQGELGLFKYSFAGNHIHVGIPKEQFLAATLMADRYRTCPHCQQAKSIDDDFGWRKINGKPAPQSWCYSCRSGSWKKTSNSETKNKLHSAAEPIKSKSIERSLTRPLRLLARLRFLPGQRVEVTLVARRFEKMPETVSLSFSDAENLEASRFHACWYSDVRPSSMAELLQHGGLVVSENSSSPYAWRVSGRKIIVFRAGEQISGFIQNSGKLEIGESYVVLCSLNLRTEVEEVFRDIGAKPKAIYTSEDGVPKGYICFKGICPSKIPSAEFTGDFDVLNTKQKIEIELSGGIRVENAVWLSGYPPVVHVFGSDLPPVTIDGIEASRDSSGQLRCASSQSAGKHIVKCGKTTKSYEILEPDCKWDAWDCHRIQCNNLTYAVCGASLWITDEGGGLAPVSGIYPTNRLLLGRNPGEIFIRRRKERTSFAQPMNVEFEPVWSVPEDPIHCDKKVCKIELLNELEPGFFKHVRLNESVRKWSEIVLDASRKGLVVSADRVGQSLWQSYKQTARMLRKRFRNEWH